MLGAETTNCDSPITLVNATFKWIEENIRDSIDFIIWGGDSARHDNDELIPRTDQQVEDENIMLVDKFVEVFGKKDRINDPDPTYDFIVPIIPTFGNNDILPHNIMDPGPSKWTRTFLSIWRQFIPEEQRHAFERGGWFFVEVIPNQLAVFNLNTLYFYAKNAAVDGCADKSEIGYEEMDWLRIQLQFIRERGMKAIIMGHVPPGRSETKRSWDETCWQKYTLWMLQYRDVVVGSMYGHMNFEHFLLQDSKEINEHATNGDPEPEVRTALDDEFTIQSADDYLNQLRTRWSRIPSAEEFGLSGAEPYSTSSIKKKRPKKSKEEKFYDQIGGPWGERYSLTLVSASVVPNYFPTIRVFEYNTSGLDKYQAVPVRKSDSLSHLGLSNDKTDPNLEIDTKFRRKPKTHKFTAPLPPSKSSPPGPAYSPQTFTWLSYRQYFANLTNINNDFSESSNSVEAGKWHSGKHSGRKPHEYGDPEKHAKKFVFEVEYDTKTDEAFGLKDLTVRSWVDLAGRIGRYGSCKADDGVEDAAEELRDHDVDIDDEGGESLDKYLDNDLTPSRSSRIQRPNSKKKKNQKHKKHKKNNGHNPRHAIIKAWFAFVSRAFVSTRDEDDLLDRFG